MRAPEIRALFDEPTKAVSYVLFDPATRRGAAIDPVLDFDAASGTVGTGAARRLLDVVAAEGVTLDWVLETHVHADHLTAAPLIARETGARIAISDQVGQVQALFAPRFAADDIKPGGGDFDRLLADGERLPLGDLEIEVLHTPGHTPACVTYVVGDAAFVGDTLFMPDYGSARCDFPGGSARSLYRSIRRILALPPGTRLFLCHDYKAPGRDHYAWETTVAEQRAANKHAHDGVAEDDYVAMREGRDATLSAPALLLPAVQVNIRGGRFPPPGPDGTRALTLPVQLADGLDPAILG